MPDNKDMLVIRKWSAENTDYMLPLKITVDLHAQVKEIAAQANSLLAR